MGASVSVLRNLRLRLEREKCVALNGPCSNNGVIGSFALQSWMENDIWSSTNDVNGECQLSLKKKTSILLTLCREKKSAVLHSNVLTLLSLFLFKSNEYNISSITEKRYLIMPQNNHRVFDE